MVKKTDDNDSRGEPLHSPTPDPLPVSLSHNKNDKKILQITNKIIELLSGEVSGIGNCGALFNDHVG